MLDYNYRSLNKYVKPESEVRVGKTIARLVMTNANEIKGEAQMIEWNVKATEMKILHKISGVTLRDRHRNVERCDT